MNNDPTPKLSTSTNEEPLTPQNSAQSQPNSESIPRPYVIFCIIAIIILISFVVIMCFLAPTIDNSFTSSEENTNSSLVEPDNISSEDSSDNSYKLNYPYSVAHRCWGAAGAGKIFAKEDLDKYATDIACAYLSYQAAEKSTPTSQDDIIKYLPADYSDLLPDDAHPTITFNANNPTEPYIFNICTSKSCDPDFNDRNITVFYRNPLRPNQMFSSGVESYDTSIYDLKNIDSWYDTIFENYPRTKEERLYSNKN